MNLMFDPKRRRLTLDGEVARWEAYFFVRSETSRGYRLFGFAKGEKVWLTNEAENQLCRTKKRKPFPVGSDLLAADVPPPFVIVTSHVGCRMPLKVARRASSPKLFF